MPVIKVTFREPRELPGPCHTGPFVYSFLRPYTESLTARVDGLATVYYPERRGGYLQLLGPHGDVQVELALDTIRTIEFA